MAEKPRTRRRSLLLTGAFATVAVVAGVAAWRTVEASKDRSSDPAARDAGRKLRAAIDQFYETLPVDNRRWTAAFDPPYRSVFTDISNIFQQHIPLGCSFDEGEAILRSAGFSISRSRATVGSKTYFSGLPTTQAHLYKLELWTLQEMSVTSVLVPVSADDFTAIASVHGYIRKTDWTFFRNF